ncbi:MAG: hypothetical protein Q9173_006259 [Seirophora scorigena]
MSSYHVAVSLRSVASDRDLDCLFPRLQQPAPFHPTATYFTSTFRLGGTGARTTCIPSPLGKMHGRKVNESGTSGDGVSVHRTLGRYDCIVTPSCPAAPEPRRDCSLAPPPRRMHSETSSMTKVRPGATISRMHTPSRLTNTHGIAWVGVGSPARAEVFGPDSVLHDVFAAAVMQVAAAVALDAGGAEGKKQG